MNSRFTMAAHILGMLAFAEREGHGPVTSERMAESIQTNPVVVRRILGDLGRAGLIETRRGAGGGVTLARRAERITLRDAYEAVEEGSEIFGRHPSGPSETCPLAPLVAEYLEGVFGRAEASLKASLDAVTVQQLASEVASRLKRRPKACAG